ncbi:MAG: ATP-binding protein [Desulfobacterales bacterium]|nr:ATP-binding protein [Desulfobacterales bacterium]
MPEGGLISVSAGRDPGHPSRVVLSVRDTGTGMDSETASRIFEPFFSTKDRGTGLGMSIAEAVVAAHGGTVAVRSEEGKGDGIYHHHSRRFDMLIVGAAKAPPSHANAGLCVKIVTHSRREPWQKASGASVSMNSVLIVDDEVEMAIALRESVLRCGLEPVVYHNLVDALAELNPPTFPHHHGYEDAENGRHLLSPEDQDKGLSFPSSSSPASAPSKTPSMP